MIIITNRSRKRQSHTIKVICNDTMAAEGAEFRVAEQPINQLYESRTAIVRCIATRLSLLNHS